MSIPIRQPIQVHIRWGKAKGKKQVQAALHACILNAFSRTVDSAIDLMKEIVPESRFRQPPYPPSYKSEQLMQTAIDILSQSLTRMGLGSGLKKRYFLRYGFPAKYAQYLSTGRRKVKWSKTSSERGFYSTIKLQIVTQFRIFLREELATQRAAKLALRKYIGAKIYG